MKKVLISVIIILLLVLTVTTITKGLQLGNFKVLGIADMKKENDSLDTKVKTATKLASTDYPQKIDELNAELKKLKTEKESYEDMVSVSTDSQIEAANQTSNYIIDFLWIRVGNHAKDEGVIIDMAITRSATGTDKYDLNFTAKGSYVGIEEFITDIEDDPKLGFKIENFAMQPATSNSKSNSQSNDDGATVQATFVCKGIKIEGLPTTSSVTSSNSTSTTNSSTTSTSTTNSTTTSGTTQVDSSSSSTQSTSN